MGILARNIGYKGGVFLIILLIYILLLENYCSCSKLYSAPKYLQE